MRVLLFTAGALAAPTLTQLEHKLEGVEAGLQKLVSGKPDAFKKTMSPLLSKVTTALSDVESKNSKLTDAQKSAEIVDALSAVKQFTSVLQSRQQELHQQDQDDKASLLLGVLQTRISDPLNDQLSLLKDPQFNDLPAAQYVLAHHTSAPVAAQIADYLDSHSAAVAVAPKPAAPGGGAPVAAAQSGSKTVTKTTKVDGAAWVAKDAQMQNVIHTLEGQVQGLQRKDAAATKADSGEHERFLKVVQDKSKKLSHGAKLQLTGMWNKDHRRYTKNHERVTEEITNLSNAIAAIKKGDMNGLNAAKEALASGMEEMASEHKEQEGDFLH
mmetsp:Transcript_21445/g.52085  ORF Transcript_21445/g.52085 Transcript_21445/m.52085 type:complete len:327 (-) Transcript_21445:113-1093(-)